MNAKELHDTMAASKAEFPGPAEMRDLILRALRLLAAAEGGEGLTVPAHMRLRPDHVGVYDEVVLASDYYALAARVAELEPDAERYRWMRDQPTANIYACWFPPVFPPVANDAEQRDRAIDAARSK